ncbi:MAG: hypothetical protein MUO82_02535 [Candidatus Thermoplasmatota archaeon]|nr:hypothetical protein [Candidatus Thermoplasmatota archaeon]
MIHMELKLLFQIVGILLSSIGSILAITELWKSYSNKVIYSLVKEFVNIRKTIEQYFEFIDKYIGTNKIDIKKQTEGLKYINENLKKDYKQRNNYEKKIIFYAKINQRFVLLGLFLIIFGCFFQIISILI